jgi:hypothetical protein
MSIMTAKRLTKFRFEKFGFERITTYTTEAWICIFGLPVRKVNGYVLIIQESKL